MTRRLRLSLLLATLATGEALAFNRGPKEYTPPTGETTYVKSKSRLGTFAEPEDAMPEEPIPWMFIGLVTLCVAGAVPFAMRYYKGMSAETEELVERQKTPVRERRTRPKATPEPEATEE